MKKLKRILSLALVLLIGSTFFIDLPAKAENVTYDFMSGYAYDFRGSGLPGNYGSANGTYQMFYADGQIAYCIEKGVVNASGVQTNMGADWSGVSAGDRETFKLALIYGFDGTTKMGYDAVTEYVGTQIYIHGVMGGFVGSPDEATFFAHALTAAPNPLDVEQVYIRIRNQVNSHLVRPSFTSATAAYATTYEATYVNGKHQIVLTDAFSVMQYYNIVEQLQAQGLTVSVSGDTLTITSDTAIPETTIFATRVGNTYAASLFGATAQYLYAPGIQTKVMAGAPRAFADPVPAYFKIKSNAADLNIIKRDSETNAVIPGATFEVFYNGVSIGKKTTDANGKITYPSQPYGTYTIKETSPATGYQANTTTTTYQLTGTSAAVTITNNIIKGRVKILKLSSYNEKPLAGAVYGIYRKADNVQVGTLTTDENGEATSALLRYGEYYLKELTAPPRQELDATPIYFSITQHNVTIEKTIYDEPLRADLIIIKADSETFEPIAGADFEIIDEDGKSLGIFTTDEDGRILLEQIPHLDYVILETQPATGYLPNENVFEYTLDAASEPLEVFNDIIKGRFRLSKTSSFDGRILPGTTYGIFRAADGVLMETLTTNGYGEAVSSLLRYGEYFMQELEPPDRYHIDPERYYFFVEEHEVVIPTPMQDAPIIGLVYVSYKPNYPVQKPGGKLNMPNTGTAIELTDPQILGYPVVPESGAAFATEDLTIEYVNPMDDPVNQRVENIIGYGVAGAFGLLFLYCVGKLVLRKRKVKNLI